MPPGLTEQYGVVLKGDGEIEICPMDAETTNKYLTFEKIERPNC